MEANASATFTVMVVDDEPDMRYMLRVALERAGYAVVEAAHGEAALDLARRAQPQIVLTDRMMPRMNGDELIERLRDDEATKAIPIVIISGTNGTQGRADAMLGKPVDVDSLLVLLDRLARRET
jgi:CheY-like chemotaxis protein